MYFIWNSERNLDIVESVKDKIGNLAASTEEISDSTNSISETVEEVRVVLQKLVKDSQEAAGI